MNTRHRLVALAGAPVLAGLLVVGTPAAPAAAADVIPQAVAQLADATAAQGVDQRPHTAQLMAYLTPAERGDQFGAALVAVWEEATATCSTVNLVVRDPDGPAPAMVAAGIETTERGVCWLYGLTELPLFA